MIKEKISDKTRYNIYIALSNLISETLEHLKKNKFNLKNIICGQTSKGVLMEIEDPYWNADFSNIVEERMVEYEKFQKEMLHKYAISSAADISEEMIWEITFRSYKEYGFHCESIEEVESLMQCCRGWSNTVYMLAPYINEYTYDILPQNPCTLMGKINVQDPFGCYIKGQQR